jgi:protein-tyrosine phosphatase
MNGVLLLCTANLCRSVMAQGLLAARLAARGVSVPVASAGLLLGGGCKPPAEVVSVMAARGIDVAGHCSRPVTADDLASATLILGLTREHVRHCAVLLPGAWPRTFTLRELVRRGHLVGPRAPGEPLGDWLARAADGRSRRALLGRDPSDDVRDPYGGPLADYQATAGLLDELTDDLAALCWGTAGSSAVAPPRSAGRT